MIQRSALNAETGKSALVAVLWAVAVKYAEFLPDELEWDILAIIDPIHMEAFVKEVWIWIGASSGGAAWWRSRNPVDKGFTIPVAQQPAQPPAIVPAPPIAEKAAVVAAPVVSAPAGTFVFGKRSLDNLATCHPDLVKVAHRALELSKYDFTVISALRTIDEQRVLFNTGKSKTMSSRHLGRDGKSFAIDFMAIGENGGTWEVTPYYAEINQAFKQAAKELGIQIVCGIDWSGFVDAGHVQLDSVVYPDEPDYKLA